MTRAMTPAKVGLEAEVPPTVLMLPAYTAIRSCMVAYAPVCCAYIDDGIMVALSCDVGVGTAGLVVQPVVESVQARNVCVPRLNACIPNIPPSALATSPVEALGRRSALPLLTVLWRREIVAEPGS